MNFKKISTKIILLTFLLILCFNNKANADSPSIKIYLKNMNTTDYTIDLLVEEKSNAGIHYNTKCRYAEYENTPIYKYNENGWIAATLRHNLILGNIKGNEKKEHSFNYLAVPYKFKVIIQYNDGTIKTSNIIYRVKDDFKMSLDVDTMKVNQIYDINTFNIIECTIITIIVESVIALIMKFKNIKSIIFTNIFTQIIIQALRLLNYNYIFNFLVAEILVFTIEYLIYRKIFKNIENKEILKYTFISNLITALLTFENNFLTYFYLVILFFIFIIYSIKNKGKIEYSLAKTISIIIITILTYIILLPIIYILLP